MSAPLQFSSVHQYLQEFAYGRRPKPSQINSREFEHLRGNTLFNTQANLFRQRQYEQAKTQGVGLKLNAFGNITGTDRFQDSIQPVFDSRRKRQELDGQSAGQMLTSYLLDLRKLLPEMTEKERAVYITLANFPHEKLANNPEILNTAQNMLTNQYDDADLSTIMDNITTIGQADDFDNETTQLLLSAQQRGYGEKQETILKQSIKDKRLEIPNNPEYKVLTNFIGPKGDPKQIRRRDVEKWGALIGDREDPNVTELVFKEKTTNTNIQMLIQEEGTVLARADGEQIGVFDNFEQALKNLGRAIIEHKKRPQRPQQPQEENKQPI